MTNQPQLLARVGTSGNMVTYQYPTPNTTTGNQNLEYPLPLGEHLVVSSDINKVVVKLVEQSEEVEGIEVQLGITVRKGLCFSFGLEDESDPENILSEITDSLESIDLNPASYSGDTHTALYVDMDREALTTLRDTLNNILLMVD
jgi:hypothetical protein